MVHVAHVRCHAECATAGACTCCTCSAWQHKITSASACGGNARALRRGACLRFRALRLCVCRIVVAVRIGAAAGVANTASANTANEGTATEPPAMPINTGNDALVLAGQSNGARSSTNVVAGVAIPGSTDPDNNSLRPLSARNRRAAGQCALRHGLRTQACIRGARV